MKATCPICGNSDFIWLHWLRYTSSAHYDQQIEHEIYHVTCKHCWSRSTIATERTFLGPQDHTGIIHKVTTSLVDCPRWWLRWWRMLKFYING